MNYNTEEIKGIAQQIAKHVEEKLMQEQELNWRFEKRCGKLEQKPRAFF